MHDLVMFGWPLVLQLQLTYISYHSITWIWWINMLSSFWLIILIFSCNSQRVESNLPWFSHIRDNGKLSPSKSLLNSIIESFKKRSQIYCVVIIHDDIGINVQSTFLSKLIGKMSALNHQFVLYLRLWITFKMMFFS